MVKLFQTVETARSAVIPPIRVTVDEKTLIEQNAQDSGMSTSDYMRRSGLGKPIRSKVAATIINELRELAQQQKDLYQDGGGVLTKEYRAILESIVSAIERIAAGEGKGE